MKHHYNTDEKWGWRGDHFHHTLYIYLPTKLLLVIIIKSTFPEHSDSTNISFIFSVAQKAGCFCVLAVILLLNFAFIWDTFAYFFKGQVLDLPAEWQAPEVHVHKTWAALEKPRALLLPPWGKVICSPRRFLKKTLTVVNLDACSIFHLASSDKTPRGIPRNPGSTCVTSTSSCQHWAWCEARTHKPWYHDLSQN